MNKPQYHHGDLKTAILDAAQQALADESLHTISMRELARRAGVSPGAPYHHFGDRKVLVSELCKRGFSSLHGLLAEASEKGSLKAMVKAYLNFAQKQYALFQLMFSAEATEKELAEELQPYASPVYALLEEEIAKSTGNNPDGLDATIPISVWCFMHGVATLSVASPLQARLGPRKLNSFASQIVEQLAGSSPTRS